MSYPTNDHRPIEPQPEFCELCADLWPGGGFRYSDVEGLRGLNICGSVKSGCNHFRSAMTFKDRFRIRRKHSVIGTGKHPVFPPGAKDWTENAT